MISIVLLFMLTGDNGNWSLIWEGFVWRLTAVVVWGAVVAFVTTILAALKAKTPDEYKRWFVRIGATLFCTGVALYLVGRLAIHTALTHSVG